MIDGVWRVVVAIRYYFPRGPGHFKFVHTVSGLTHQNHVDCVVVFLIYVLASFQGKIHAFLGETNPNLCTPSENEAKMPIAGLSK